MSDNFNYKEFEKSLVNVPKQNKKNVIKQLKRIRKIKWFKPIDKLPKTKIRLIVNSVLKAFKINKKVEIVAYFEKPEDVFAKAMEVNITNAKVNSGRLIVNVDSSAKENVYKKSSRLRRVKELIQRNFNLELIVN